MDIIRVAVSTASALAFLPAIAQAQEAPPAQPGQSKPAEGGSEPDDIIVTAQHREERLQDVGISISALSSQQLSRLGVTSSIDIGRITPGVHVSGNFGGQTAQYTIRGVTQNDFSDVLEGPVAVYFDDGYIGSLSGQIFGTFDLERVEILKGPQGTLFGRNATGGLVHFIPKKPTDQLSINANASYGRFNQARLEVGVGGPLGEGLSARVSAVFSRQDPIFKNVYPAGVLPTTPPNTPPARCCEDTWNDNTLGGRLQLQYETGGWKVRLQGSALRSIASTSPYKSFPSMPVFNSAGHLIDTIRLPETDPVLGAIQQPRDNNNISQVLALNDRNRMQAYNAALHIDGSIGGVDVALITDWKRLKKSFLTDTALVPVNFLGVASDANTQQLSQELRLSGKSDSLHWSAGAYYLDLNARDASGFLIPKGSILAVPLTGSPNGADLINFNQLKTQSFSLFSQIDWKFAPQLTLVAGGRIIFEHQSYFYRSALIRNDRDYYIDSVELAPLPAYQKTDGTLVFDPYRNSRKSTLWAGKLQLEYRPNSDTLVYVGVNRGVKGGAYNAKYQDGTLPLLESQMAYGPETLWSYEGGVKATLLNGAIVGSAAAFYYDYKNYQAFLFINSSGLVTNTPATNYGIEASLQIKPTDRLSVTLGGSVFRPKVKGVITAPATPTAPAIVKDTEPAFAPREQYSATVNWTLPVANDAISLSVNANYTGRFFNNLRNFTGEVTKGYWLTGANVDWKLGSGFTAAAALDNIFDKRVNVIGFDLTTFCGCMHESYNRPRTWRVSLRYEM